MIAPRDIPKPRLDRSVLLQDATVQEIQLELLRRTSFNGLDGQRVAESLLRHRNLWLSVMLQRQPYWSKDYTHLSFSWLIQMRDMPRNVWNADTLFIVTDGIEKARRLELIATNDDDHWNGEVTVYEDQEEVDRALGTGRHPHAIVTVWWD